MVQVVDRLAGLVVRLYAETEGYLDNPADAQLWYNRGYANGVVAALRGLGIDTELDSRLRLDEAGLHGENRLMEWTKAYHHGVEMGEREAREVLPSA